MTTQEFDADAVLAKSDGKSLLQHTEDCLIVYRNLAQALPMLPSLTELENFFDLLFCSVYLHDWGKAHKEFQKVLKQQKNQWCRNRHEIFSVPFAEMLPFDSEQKELIAQAVLGHHKDFEAILHYFYSDEEIEAYRLDEKTSRYPGDDYDRDASGFYAQGVARSCQRIRNDKSRSKPCGAVYKTPG